MRKSMKQPVLGIAATVVCIVVSLAIVALFDPATFGTWATLILEAMVPGQIVLSLVWESTYPGFVGRLAQPVKGLVLAALMTVAGFIVAPIALLFVGGWVTPPTPYVLLFLIFSVVVAFWLITQMQCWPLTAITEHPLGVGVGTWLLSYILAYFIFQVFFDFGFLEGSPAYLPGLDPGGVFNAWNSLSFAVTALLVMVAFVLLDFWPLSRFAARVQAFGRQPVFGIVATLCVLLIAWLIWAYFVLLQNMDPVVFMVKVPVSIIFGEFIMLIMLQTSPVQTVTQPLKGLVLVGFAVLLSVLTYALYSFVGRVLFGGLTAGAPAYRLDLWLASAMLAVTFPMFVLYAQFFGYWPLASNESAQDSR